MSEHIKAEAEKHRVKYDGGRKNHFFKVFSGSAPMSYNVMLQASCDCAFMARYGIANGEICSHIIAVLNDITSRGRIQRGESRGGPKS